MIIYSILIVLAAAFTFLLLTPIVIEFDSEQNLYEVRVAGIVRMRIVFGEQFILIKMRAFGFEKTLNPLQLGSRKIRKEKQINKTDRISFQKAMHKGMAVIRTFDVRYLLINIDTDDYAMNGLLYPFAVLVSKPNRQFQINFQGRVEVKVKIVNNLSRMFLAFIR